MCLCAFRILKNGDFSSPGKGIEFSSIEDLFDARLYILIRIARVTHTNTHLRRERKKSDIQKMSSLPLAETTAAAATDGQHQEQHSRGDQGELLELIPLGAGSEVGRSCVVASFFAGKKNVMFDCGIHPGFQG